MINRSVVIYYENLEEGRIGGYIAGALTGIGGVATGGQLAALHQAQYLSAAELEVKRRKGKLKDDLRKPDPKMNKRNLRSVLKGMVPLVGSIANVKLAKKRYDLDDKLKKEDAAKEKKKMVDKEIAKRKKKKK